MLSDPLGATRVQGLGNMVGTMDPLVQTLTWKEVGELREFLAQWAGKRRASPDSYRVDDVWCQNWMEHCGPYVQDVLGYPVFNSIGGPPGAPPNLQQRQRIAESVCATAWRSGTRVHDIFCGVATASPNRRGYVWGQRHARRAGETLSRRAWLKFYENSRVLARRPPPG